MLSFKSFHILLAGRIASSAFLFGQGLLQISLCNELHRVELIGYLVITNSVIAFGRLGAEFHFPKMLFQKVKDTRSVVSDFINVISILSLFQALAAVLISAFTSPLSASIAISIILLVVFQNLFLALTEITRAVKGQNEVGLLLLVGSALQLLLILTVAGSDTGASPSVIIALQATGFLIASIFSAKMSALQTHYSNLRSTRYRRELGACIRQYSITLAGAARTNVDLIVAINVLQSKELVFYYVITRFTKIFQVLRSQLSSYLYPYFASPDNLSTKYQLMRIWRTKEIGITLVSAAACILFLNTSYGKHHFGVGGLLPLVLFFSAFVAQSMVGQAQTFLIYNGKSGYVTTCLLLPTLLFICLVGMARHPDIEYFSMCYMLMAVIESALLALATRYWVSRHDAAA